MVSPSLKTAVNFSGAATPSDDASCSILPMLRISARAGQLLLVPLCVLGAATVWYWRWSATAGIESLNPYGAVQFGSALLVLLMLVLFPARYTRSGEGIERLRSVRDEHAAHEALLADNRDPVAAAGHAVRHLTAVAERAANANHAAADETSRAEQVTGWVTADRAREAATSDELAATR